MAKIGLEAVASCESITDPARPRAVRIGRVVPHPDLRVVSGYTRGMKAARFALSLSLVLSLTAVKAASADGLVTWDGKHSIDRIEVTVAYFVPRDRTPLVDWRERVDYFCRRIERFHQREFGGQSVLSTKPLAEPFRSARTTAQLRAGNGDFTFFQTLREVDTDLEFGKGERKAFPILLVLSDVNWRPLDDFFRLRPSAKAAPQGPGLEFEGSLSDGRHFPGAASGGARATYLADRGVGWGLVSADGWRVPYCGSDCVVYHEGVGHAIGLPHPEPGNDSVMGFGQYKGWISQSWVDEDQKKRLKWKPPEKPFDRKSDLFSTFRALSAPVVPKPGEAVSLTLTWPDGAQPVTLRVRIQTDLFGPWIDVAVPDLKPAPAAVRLGTFDRPTPVSYRIEAELADKQAVELWGYFQVRAEEGASPLPSRGIGEPGSVAGPDDADRRPPDSEIDPRDEVDLLSLVDVDKDGVSGKWSSGERTLESPKAFGARIELPYEPPEEYRLTVIAEPLDEPNGLLLGQRSGDRRFVTLVGYATGKLPSSALENVDGKNVGNATTVEGRFLKKGRPSQIVVAVRKGSVTVTVDGREIIDWKGDRARLSLSDYWKTPHENVLFLGAYDCRYRFTRVTLQPLTGEGKPLRP